MNRVLNSFGLKALLIFASFLTLAQTSFATTVVVPSDDEMIIGARVILRGKVVAIESSFDENTSRTYTYVTVKVQEVFKGAITERFVILKELGGQAGGHGTQVFGNPQFAQGERVVLYLDTWKDGSLRTHQMFLGKFSISEDNSTGKLFAVRSGPDGGVSVIARNSQSTEPITERMELSAYLRMVRERLQVNWDRSQAFEQTYYHDVPLLAKPNEYQKLKSKGDVEPSWTYISSQHPRWFEPDAGQTVNFVVNTASAPQPNIMDDVNAAMNAWSTVSSCALRVANSGATGECNEGVGLNLIQFSGCDGRWSPGGCSGVLALGGLSWFGGNTRVINGVTFAQGTAGFVSMNPNAACYFTSHCRVAEVLTHELGHAMGLGHSADTTATMYAIAHFDNRCASLMPDDQAAVQFIYPGTGGGPGPLTVTTTALGNGTIGTTYSQSLLCSGGTAPYSWSIVSGTGSLPGGLGLTAGTGLISGTPTATGTFNFTVRVTDGASATADKALSIVVTQPGIPYNSQFVSQVCPTSVPPGQSFNVTMTWLNTGTQTWSAPVFYLVTQNPPGNYTWLGGPYNAIDLSQFTVPPGQQLSFTFGATAPASMGTYNFQWQLYKDNGTTFFGQMSTNCVITVEPQRFTDVPPSNPYYSYVQKIAALGITVGCTQTTYCPDGNVTRAEMAVFIERVFGAFNPPTPQSQRFTDVPPGSWAYNHIGDFANRGITVGCTPTTYCPNGNVTRAEMAVFMERANGRPDPTPPPTARFVDVPTSHWAFAQVESFITNGLSQNIMDAIKRGCNADGVHFCPNQPLTRAEMAAWLVISFNL